MLSPARKTLALICAVALVIVAVPSLFVLPAEQILFQPAPYQQQLANQNIYARLPSWLAAITVPSGSTAEQNALALMGKNALQSLYAQALSPQWSKSQADGLITQLWDFLNFKTTTLTLMVDLRPLKARLSEDGPDSIGGRIVRSWPACNLDQFLKLSDEMANGLVNGVIPPDMPLCRPPDNLMPMSDKLMQAAFTAFADTIPAQVNLVDYFKADPNFTQQQATLVNVFAGYTALRWTGRVLPWVALVLLVMLIALSAVSWRKVFTYTGVSILAAGTLGVITVVLLWALGNYVTGTLVKGMTTVSDDMLKAFVLAIQQVFSSFLLWSGVLAVIVAAIGLVAFGLPLLIRQSNVLPIQIPPAE
jgi:hypothetical protein